jgi:large-conductance mechanosensitive channel
MVKGVRNTGNTNTGNTWSLAHTGEIAIAVVVALKARDLVDSFVDNVAVQAVAGVINRPTLTSDTVTVGDARLYLGAFVATGISIVIYALLFLVAVAGYRRFRRRSVPTGAHAPAESREAELLIEIRDALREGRSFPDQTAGRA